MHDKGDLKQRYQFSYRIYPWRQVRQFGKLNFKSFNDSTMDTDQKPDTLLSLRDLFYTLELWFVNSRIRHRKLIIMSKFENKMKHAIKPKLNSRWQAAVTLKCALKPYRLPQKHHPSYNLLYFNSPTGSNHLVDYWTKRRNTASTDSYRPVMFLSRAKMKLARCSYQNLQEI